MMAELYNQNMGGVDILDQKLGTYLFPHKTGKWYMAVYHRIIEVAMVNAHIIHSKDKGADAMVPRKFRENVIASLVSESRNVCVQVGDNPSRLSDKHFPGKGARRQCVVCSDRRREGWKRTETMYTCKQCNKSMCVVPCFEIFHTYTDYKRAASRIVYGQD